MRPIKHHNPESEQFIRALNSGPRAQILDQLRSLQMGERPLRAKPWKGKKWTGYEITISGLRVVGYTRPEAIVVLHAFKKDASRGKKTRQHHIDLINKRYSASQAQYK